MKQLTAFSPRLYPDEHLLSALARLVKLKGEKSFLTTFQSLSGDSNVMLPGAILRPWYHRISALFPAMRLEDLIRDHTLWNYYQPFMDPSISQVPPTEAWSNLYNGRSQWLPSKHVRIRHTQYWRWCTDCVREDKAQFGVAYWHCSHQLPGVTQCPEHSTPLAGQCQECGHAVYNLERQLKPPESDSCPQCGHNLSEKIPEGHDEFFSWLQNITSGLLLNNSRLDWPEQRARISAAHNLQPIKSNSKVAVRKHYSAKIKELDSKLDKEITSWLLTQHETYRSGRVHDALHLKMLFSEQLYPPLCYLILTWALLGNSEYSLVS